MCIARMIVHTVNLCPVVFFCVTVSVVPVRIRGWGGVGVGRAGVRRLHHHQHYADGDGSDQRSVRGPPAMLELCLERWGRIKFREGLLSLRGSDRSGEVGKGVPIAEVRNFGSDRIGEVGIRNENQKVLQRLPSSNTIHKHASSYLLVKLRRRWSNESAPACNEIRASEANSCRSSDRGQTASHRGQMMMIMMITMIMIYK